MTIRNIVGMAFHHEFDIGLRLQHLCYLTQYLLRPFGHGIFAAGKKELVGNIDIDHAFVHLDIDIIVVEIADRAFEIAHKGHVQ